MFAMKKSIQTVLLSSAIASIGGSTASAQCLLDVFGWGKSSSAPATSPYAVPGYPYAANYPVVPAGYPVQAQPMVGGMPYSAGYAGVPQSAISLAAPTNYNTSYFPVPTTYYRPVTTTDPRTGQQVTTMMPCTSYQMQALRSPAWSLGQWVQGGNQAPMVPAAALPAATSSPGLMPPGTNPSAVSGMVPNAADPNSVPTLPAINPTLPVYGTQVQSSYGNPSAVVNTQPAWSGYNNGVVSANYMPAAPASGYANTTPVQANSNSYGATTGGVYPSDWNNSAAAGNGWNNSTPNGYVNGTMPATSVPNPGSPSVSNSGAGVYPSIPNDAQYRANPMFSAEPPTSNGPVASDAGATEKPILPPTDSTSQVERQPNPSLLSSNDNQGRVQSVVRQPSPDMREMSSKSIERVPNPVNSENARPLPQNLGAEPKPTVDGKGTLGPALKPIPLPDGFDTEPQWNPSLLNSSDKTASVPSLENSSQKMQPVKLPSDDVRWASFSDTANNPTSKNNTANSVARPVESGRRPVVTSAPKTEVKSRYDADGWKSAK
jgi:hypothetical protein